MCTRAGQSSRSCTQQCMILYYLKSLHEAHKTWGIVDENTVQCKSYLFLRCVIIKSFFRIYALENSRLLSGSGRPGVVGKTCEMTMGYLWGKSTRGAIFPPAAQNCRPAVLRCSLYYNSAAKVTVRCSHRESKSRCTASPPSIPPPSLRSGALLQTCTNMLCSIEAPSNARYSKNDWVPDSVCQIRGSHRGINLRSHRPGSWSHHARSVGEGSAVNIAGDRHADGQKKNKMPTHLNRSSSRFHGTRRKRRGSLPPSSSQGKGHGRRGEGTAGEYRHLKAWPNFFSLIKSHAE